MYPVDERDRVVEVFGLPSPTAGASSPLVAARDSGQLVIAYFGASPQDEVIFVKFAAARAHYLGPPNDEALQGHPLATRGLKQYGIFEVKNSSWIRALEKMNRVHPMHDPRRFDALRHWVFTFHDSTFECVAIGAEVVGRAKKSPENDEGRILKQAASWF